MDRWMDNGLIGGWMDEWINKWPNEQMNKQMNIQVISIGRIQHFAFWFSSKNFKEYLLFTSIYFIIAVDVKSNTWFSFSHPLKF